MKICDILEEQFIRTDLPGTNKSEVINAMVDIVGTSKKIHELEKVRTAILEREKIMSTGVGNGFAIPHGKTEAVSDIVAAFAITKNPIDYQALDDQPVRLVFLLVGKDSLVGPHIKLLSRISRLMNKEEFRKKILECTSPQEVLATFKQEEASYFDI